MKDSDHGKRFAEEMVLEQVLDAYPSITGRTLTEVWDGDFLQVEGSPDFIVGIDGRAHGIELAELRAVGNAWAYYEEASRLACQKHESYARRGLFAHPISLILYAHEPPLFDIQRELIALIDEKEFEGLGFTEVWTIDFSDAYYTPGHPLRMADMFCLKPRATFGFYRVGDHGRKPYG